MSLDYELRIVTDWEPEKILALMEKEFQLERGEYPRLFNSGIILGVFKESDRGQNFTHKNFGFSPTVDVWFRLNSRKDYDRGKHTLLMATMRLIDRLPGDAILLFNGETIVLQRIGGTLIFNKDLGTWSESELAEVKLPFYLDPLPSPLLTDELPSLKIANGVHTRIKSLALRQGKSVTEIANEALEAYLNNLSADVCG